MFFGKARKQRSNAEVADGGLPLLLQTTGLPSLGYFPANIVEAHRYMITRMVREQSMPKRLSMVSAIRGEGVTYSSLALATTLSHDFAQRVCYVDLNWWWPSPQIEPLNQQSQGVAGILAGDVKAEDALVKTRSGNLSLLPAGKLPLQQRPVIARSPMLKEMLMQLDEHFDTMVLDIPAVLMTSDAMALATLGETCVIVVRQGVTTTSSIKQALTDIIDVPVAGVMLNRVKIATPAWIHNWIPDL